MKKILLFAFLLISMVCQSHPGHGGHEDSGYTIIHYFTQPVHALTSIAIIAVIILGLVKLFSKKGSTRDA